MQNNITFKFSELDSPSEIFVILKLSAILNEEEIGFILVRLFPKDLFEKKCIDVWNYLSLIANIKINKEDSEFDKWKKIMLHEEININKDFIPSEKLMKKDLNLFIKKYQTKMQNFIISSLDHPKIYGASVNYKFQKQGIATELYIKMSKLLAEKNLALYQDSLQSEEGKLLWQSFERKGIAQKNKNGELSIDFR